MRGDVVYHVYGVHAGRDEDVYLGAFRTVFEAEAEIAKLKAREVNGRNWAEQYHNSGFIMPCPPGQVLCQAHCENQTGDMELDPRRCISPQRTGWGRGKGLSI